MAGVAVATIPLHRLRRVKPSERVEWTDVFLVRRPSLKSAAYVTLQYQPNLSDPDQLQRDCEEQYWRKK